MTEPDPKTVREETIAVDFATPLTITNIAIVYYAYDEQDESWEGAGFFTHFDDALWMTARSWANEEYGYDATPPEKTTWRKGRHLWRLYDGESPTDIVVSDSPLLGSAPDEPPTAERDGDAARIAELERELLALRGTELNPSPTILDAQAYGELRDAIAATMGDGWDLDEAEISILIKYVRWLAAGQPRDEDGYPIRRETYPAPEAAQEAAAQDEELGSALARINATLERHAARGTHGGEYLDDDIRSILKGRMLWKTAAEAKAAEQDGDVRAVVALMDAAGGLPIPQLDAMPDLRDALNVLCGQFETRIAALDARDAKAER